MKYHALAILLIIHVSACGSSSTPVTVDTSNVALSTFDTSSGDLGGVGDTQGLDTYDVMADSGSSVDAADSSTPVEESCDPLQPQACTLPWPSNLYLKADPARVTGLTLTFAGDSLPQNIAGSTIDPKPYARLDGYSVGSSLLVQFPNVDISSLAQQTSIELSLQPTASLLWLEVDPSGKIVRQIPYFVELDQRPNAPSQPGTGDLVKIDPATQVLVVRPATILEYNTRYVIGFRNLKNTLAQPIARSPAFEALVAGTATGNLAKRQAQFNDIFAVLAQAGMDKTTLTLAWDFHTESSAAIHNQVVALRDTSLAVVGTKGPTITVTGVKTYALSEKDGQDMAFDVTGTVHVPSFVHAVDVGSGATGWRWNLNAQGQFEQNGYRDAPFWLRVPRSCLGGQNACDLLQYGHGLNGSGTEIFSHWVAPNANQRHLIYFASDMIGMAEQDVATIFMLFNNMTNWPCLPERVSQGLVEHILISRAMQQQAAGLQALVDNGVKLTGNMYYSGNSQGGIYGQSLLALQTEITRAHVGQPGLFYSMLLERSADFNDYLPFFQGAYPARVDQVVMLAVLQLLWDQVDPGTYVRHMSKDLFAGTPAHTALAVLHPGDFQVDPVTEEMSLRAGVYQLMAHYGHTVVGVSEQPYPQTKSALLSIDFGNPWAHAGNVPAGPSAGQLCGDPGQDGGACLGTALCDPKQNWGVCDLDDPHDRAHGLAAHNDQMVHFFHTGEIADFCGGDGCQPQ